MLAKMHRTTPGSVVDFLAACRGVNSIRLPTFKLRAFFSISLKAISRPVTTSASRQPYAMHRSATGYCSKTDPFPAVPDRIAGEGLNAGI